MATTTSSPTSAPVTTATTNPGSVPVPVPAQTADQNVVSGSRLPSFASLQLPSSNPSSASASRNSSTYSSTYSPTYTTAPTAVTATTTASATTALTGDKIILPSISNLNLPLGTVGPVPALQPAFRATTPPAMFKQSPSQTSNVSPLSSAPGSSPRSTSPSTATTPEVDDIVDKATTLEADDNINARKWKPRKKRQCPECKQYFSNLATHKSTHLNPASRPHICEYCSRGFARPNDLFRHVKCHWKEIGSDKGQFKCPYKSHSSGDHCGHTSGIFSRCDTFKNHLKAIHFQYPSGTKKDQRQHTGGTCRMCQDQFGTVDEWLSEHLEKNRCPYANDLKKK